MESEKDGRIRRISTDMLTHSAFQALLDNTSDLVFVKDADLRYVTASLPFIKMTGRKAAAEIVGCTDFDIFTDKNLAKRYIADDRRLLENGQNLINYIEPLADDNGQARYGSTSKYILSDSMGRQIGILGITRDITRDYITRQYYQQELRYLFELPADTYAVSYIDIDSWRMISQRKQNIYDSTLQPCHTIERLCEAAVESIVDQRSEPAVFYRDFSPAALRSVYASGRNNLSFEYQRRLSNGAVHWVCNTVRFLVDVDSGHLCAMLIAKDIDAKKHKEQELFMAAKMDQMTKLLNRETTMEYIRQTLADEAETRHALFMIDVDNFKRLNDTLGHQVGDEFLIALAAQLKMVFRETDIVGRIGGDEFFAFMKDVPELALVTKKAQSLLAAIQQVCAQYATVSLSGSIGISCYPECGQSVEELYQQADLALYQAKRQGKNQFIFSAPSR